MEPGNIDLKNRPRVKNPDGSISTVRSIGVNIDGKEVLLPTVSDSGQNLTTEQAVQLYRQTGKHLGKFNSVEESNKYAQQLHNDQAKLIQPNMDERQELAEYKEYLEYQEYLKGFNKAPSTMDKAISLGKQALGAGTAHMVGVAQPLADLILPKGAQMSDMKKAMDPKNEHDDAYLTGQLQGVATPVTAASPMIASNPIARKVAIEAGKGVLHGAGIGGMAKLLGIWK